MHGISGIAAAVVWLAASPVFACPLCHSETGQQVRAGIFDDAFGVTLLGMILPFLVMSLIVTAIHGGPCRLQAGGPADDPPETIGD